MAGGFRNRSKLQIIAKILQTAATADGVTTKSRMIYNTFSSYREITRYIEMLISQGLLNYQVAKKKQEHNGNGTILYSLTEKGKRFLHLYRELEKIEDDMTKELHFSPGSPLCAAVMKGWGSGGSN